MGMDTENNSANNSIHLLHAMDRILWTFEPSHVEIIL